MQNILIRIRRDTNLQDLLRHSGILYLSGLIAITLTFIQQITTARLLGSFDYGRFAIVLSSGLMITVLLDFRTWEVGSKLLAQPLEAQKHIEAVRVISWLWVLEISAGVIGAVIMLILAEPVALYLLHSPDLTWLIRLYAISIPFRIMTTGILGVVPRFFNRFDWLAVKAVAYAGIRLILISGAALLGLGLAGVVVAALLSEILHMMMLIVMGLGIWRRNMSDAPVFDLRKPANFQQGVRMLPVFWINSTLLGIHLHLFIPLAALLTNPTQIGIFRVGLDIMELLDKAIQPLWVVFTPKIIMLYTPQKLNEFRRYLRQCAAITNTITILLMAIMVVASPFVLPHLLSGQDYNGVVPVTIILTVANAVYIALLWTRPAIITTGLMSRHNVLTFALLILSLVVLVSFVPSNGAVGAAVAKAVFLALSGIGSLLLLRSRVQL